MVQVLAVMASYFIGSFLTAGVIASLKRVDLQKKGSGNPGATNIYRVFGAFYGVLTLVGDAAKGIIGTLLGYWAGGHSIAALCGIAVVIGHNWPLFFNFRGGKGIAASLGVLIVLMPRALVIIVPIWVLVLAVSGYVSLASLVAAVSIPFASLLFYPKQELVLLFAIIAPALAIYRHWSNIQRLISGEEHKFRFKGEGKGKKILNGEEKEEES